jgi:hypothetical protein
MDYYHNPSINDFLNKILNENPAFFDVSLEPYIYLRATTSIVSVEKCNKCGEKLVWTSIGSSEGADGSYEPDFYFICPKCENFDFDIQILNDSKIVAAILHKKQLINFSEIDDLLASRGINLSAQRINKAVSYLKKHNIIEVEYAQGTYPYDFLQLTSTQKTYNFIKN